MAIDTDFDFVVAGATGWLGQATLAYLYREFGRDASKRVHAFASSERALTLGAGVPIRVRALDDLPSLMLERPAIVFHYAFRTKDSVGKMTLDEYLSSNEGIRQAVIRFIDGHEVAGMFIPSSGAAYAGLDPDNRSDGAIYGRCKLDDEHLFGDKAAQRGFPAIISRVFNLSGAYINKHELYALSSIILACLEGRPIRIQATHPVWRSYYAVEDLIRLGMAAMLDGGLDSSALFDTVGTEVIEIGELAQRCRSVLGALGSSVERPHVKAIPNNYYVGDPERIRALEQRFSFAPRSLDEQIVDTAAYLTGLAKKAHV
ncbi:NAD-dependent epimerase/dehydratase family protein [Trinickia acidisoli]|uniref:NAD-dependent epimerase/dehydratase family protein n=1 Tax=Trinickia acidisoli TaxID=2767482 RepID=UPI001A907D21|nr:NAD-dependent epimerase/dehydratase family protein [Trinickia acidisoli]